MSTQSRSDLIGRLFGMLAFLLGVTLLIVVFNLAYHLFNLPPNEALGLKFTGDPKTDPTAMAIGSSFSGMLRQIALLFVMALAGALIGHLGIRLYFSAHKPHSGAVVVSPPPDTTPVASPPSS